MTVGLLEAITSAIGEADTEIGGLYKTRLTSTLTTGIHLGAVLLGTWTWDGTTTVLATNTSQVVVGNWIVLFTDAQAFQITAITPNVDVTIANPESLTIPTGAGASGYLPFIWDGTTVVSSTYTAGVAVGDWIQLISDGQYFEIASIVAGTSVTILNPNNFVIPGTVGAPLSTGSYKAVVTLPVETTLGWDSSGVVAVGGIVYHYTGTTATTFTGVTHIAGGISRPGVFKAHRIEAAVVDLNRSRNAIDLARRAMLVDYAEEEYLDVLGRNVGVPRSPYLTGDDTTFREVVKALGYSPRGTIYAMELLLDALVSAGNYTISEDLISYPCTVFIDFVGSASTAAVSKGKAFVKDIEPQPAASNTTVVVSRTPLTVGSVRWKNEDNVTVTTTAKPSAEDLDEYTGDTGRKTWAFVSAGGGSEANNVTLLPITTDSGAIQFTTAVDNNDALYRHLMRIRPESDATLELVATIPTGVNPHAAEPNQAALAMYDMGRAIGAGIVNIDANNFGVGLTNPVAGTYLVGSAVTLAKGTYHTIMIRKIGQATVELEVNGIVVETALYTAFPVDAVNHRVDFGIFLNPPTNNPFFRVRQVAFYARTLTDYWNARGTAGQTAGANPTRLTDAAFNDFQTTDVGQALNITGSAVTNPKGGNNNGRFLVATRVGATAVTLVGASQTGAAITSNKRVVVSTSGYQFRYPDDLGKIIAIAGGEHVIEALFSQGSGNPDLSDGEVTNPVSETTNICEVVGTPLTVATDQAWNLKPVFINEGPGLDWEMSDAGSFSGTTVTLRQALPIPNGSYTRVLDVLFSDVLSAQVLLDNTVANLLDAYYPFYIADPLGFVRSYLDTVTAAGMIPDFETT